MGALSGNKFRSANARGGSIGVSGAKGQHRFNALKIYLNRILYRKDCEKAKANLDALNEALREKAAEELRKEKNSRDDTCNSSARGEEVTPQLVELDEIQESKWQDLFGGTVTLVTAITPI